MDTSWDVSGVATLTRALRNNVLSWATCFPLLLIIWNNWCKARKCECVLRRILKSKHNDAPTSWWPPEQSICLLQKSIFYSFVSLSLPGYKHPWTSMRWHALTWFRAVNCQLSTVNSTVNPEGCIRGLTMSPKYKKIVPKEHSISTFHSTYYIVASVFWCVEDMSAIWLKMFFQNVLVFSIFL